MQVESEPAFEGVNALAQIVDSTINIHSKAGKLDDPVLLLEPVQSYKLHTGMMIQCAYINLQYNCFNMYYKLFVYVCQEKPFYLHNRFSYFVSFFIFYFILKKKSNPITTLHMRLSAFKTIYRNDHNFLIAPGGLICERLLYETLVLPLINIAHCLCMMRVSL